jgi:WD40 repeat protein
MKMSKRSGLALAVLLSVAAGVSALTLWGFGILGRSTASSQYVAPFKTVKVSDSLVYNLAVTPDGKYMVTASWNDYNKTTTGMVSLWRLEDWKSLYTATYSDIPQVLVTPDGKSFVVVAGNSIEYRSLPDSRLGNTLTSANIRRPVAFSPDWKAIATAGSLSNSITSMVRLLRAQDGALIRTIQVNTGELDDLAFSPDGQLIATPGFDDNSVRLWRVADGSPVRVMRGHTSWVTNVEFSPDGLTLASGGWDGKVRLWRVSDGTLLQELKLANVEGVVFSPDGTLVAAGSDYDWARLWRVSDGALVAELSNAPDQFGSGGKVLALQFSPDGKTVYGGTLYGTVRFWHVPQAAPTP